MTNNKNNADKEWLKIKEYNIFESFEEFSKLFIEKPNGKCLRKYTSYPWSKENFFFGTQQELYDYYKNSTDIPFYLENKIGKRFGHLIITGFYRDEQNVLMANCKCDCGNETGKKWSGIDDGNTRTCGCRNGKGKRDTLITDLFPSIIDKYWDYEKNKVLPNQVEATSQEYFWWKGYNNTNFQMQPIALSAKNKGTSFPEQAIYYFLKKEYSNVVNRKKIKYENKSYEADIYIEDINVAIEYDGYAWHKNKEDKEELKNIAFKNLDIYLIRIRESGLSESNLEYGKNIVCNIDDYTYNQAIVKCINDLFEILNNIDVSKKIKTITIDELLLQKSLIMAQYVVGYDENSIQQSWLLNFWNDENGIEPYKVSILSRDKLLFKCNQKYDIEMSPYYLNNVGKSKKSEEFYKTLLNDNECPFASNSYCPCNKLYHFNKNLNCPYFEQKNKGEICTVEFDLFKNTFSKNIKTLSNTKNLTPKEELIFVNTFRNLSSYKHKEVDNIISNFIRELPLGVNLTMELMHNTFHYPYLDIDQTTRLFQNNALCEFYVTNCKLPIEIQENVCLNFYHKYNVFDVFKALIYNNKIESVISTLKILSHRLKDKIVFNNFIVSLLLQIIIKTNYRFKELFDKRKILYNLLNSIKTNFDLIIDDTLKPILDGIILENVNVIQKQNELQMMVFEEIIKSEIINNNINGDLLLSIGLKLSHPDNFSSLLKNIICKFNFDLPKNFVDAINSCVIGYNLCDEQYNNRRNMFGRSSLGQIEFHELKDITKIKKLINSGLCFDCNDKWLIETKDNDLIYKYYKNKINKHTNEFYDVSQIKDASLLIRLLELHFGNFTYDVRILDNPQYIDIYFDMFRNFCNQTILTFQNDEWLEQAIIRHIDVLSNCFLKKLKRTLRYVGGNNRACSRYVLLKMPELAKKIKNIN